MYSLILLKFGVGFVNAKVLPMSKNKIQFQIGLSLIEFNERYLSHRRGQRPVLPPTILTESVAQVGACLILAKPENRERLIYFMGIDRVRYRHPVYPGDAVRVEASVVKLRGRVGWLQGVGRVNGRVVIEGRMTFALGPRPT